RKDPNNKNNNNPGMGKKKITSNQAIATAGRRLPGTIPNKAMRIAKSAQMNNTRAQDGNSAKSATVQTMSDSLEDLVVSTDSTTVREVHLCPDKAYTTVI